MPDVDFTSSAGLDKLTEPQSVCCPRCSNDLTGRLRNAAFCPQCGLALSKLPPGQTVALASQPATVDPLVRRNPCDVVDLVAEWEAYEAAQKLAAKSVGGRSEIVAGYARALYRLGWEYERRSGHSHNLGEAIRCYKKAARHGNAEALARLAPQCATGTSTSVDPTRTFL